MKKLFIIIIIFISFQSWTKADDIRDFQIEGISIGDSLLNLFSEEELIEQFKGNFYNYPNSNRIFESSLPLLKSNIYDEIQVSLINNDKKYIVQNINGTIYFGRNFNECLKKKTQIENDLSILFSIKKTTEEVNHPSDPTGRSPVKASWYTFLSNDHVGIVCTNFHVDTGLKVSLKVLISSFQYNDFLSNEAYK